MDGLTWKELAYAFAALILAGALAYNQWHERRYGKCQQCKEALHPVLTELVAELKAIKTMYPKSDIWREVSDAHSKDMKEIKDMLMTIITRNGWNKG